MIVVAIIAVSSLVVSLNSFKPSFAGVTRFPNGSLALGTTTSSVLTGDILMDSTGTTTVTISSSAAGKGGCINMESNLGAPVAIYVVGTTVTTAAGYCR